MLTAAYPLWRVVLVELRTVLMPLVSVARQPSRVVSVESRTRRLLAASVVELPLPVVSAGLVLLAD